MTSLAPIILFVYNRPNHTRQTIEALLHNDWAELSDIYIYADGPKLTASDDDKRKIAEVRNFIHSIEGFHSVHIIEQSVNKGLDPSEIDAISEIIGQYGKVIVLEDDVITHPYFIRFMNDALDFYEKNNKVNSIGSFHPNIPYINKLATDIYASYRTATWGWATWKDRWSLCRWDKSYLLDQIIHCNKFKFNRGGEDLYDNLQHYLQGITDAWDARWQYSMYENNTVCIYPTKSLSFNIGLDGTGVHCGIVTDENFIRTILYDKEEYSFTFKRYVTVPWKLQYIMRHFYSYNKIKIPYNKRIKWAIKKTLKFITYK